MSNFFTDVNLIQDEWLAYDAHAPYSAEILNWVNAQRNAQVHFQVGSLYLPPHLREALVQRYPQLDDYKTLKHPHGGVVDKVSQNYTLPFKPYPYQLHTIEALAGEDTAGLWFEVGTGKTFTAAVMALYQRRFGGHIIVVMPPILIPQWARFWRSIPELSNSVLPYRGTVKERKALNLDSKVILMSMDIFKNDFDRILRFFIQRDVTLIVDEAISVKNPNTMNHKCVKIFNDCDMQAWERLCRRENKSERLIPGKKGQRKDVLEIQQTKQKIMALLEERHPYVKGERTITAISDKAKFFKG